MSDKEAMICVVKFVSTENEHNINFRFDADKPAQSVEEQETQGDQRINFCFSFQL